MAQEKMRGGVKPIQFIGPCSRCNASADIARNAIEISLDGDTCGDMICLACATKLVLRIAWAVVACRENSRKGLEYRHERWQAKAKEPTAPAEDDWRDVEPGQANVSGRLP